MMPMRTPVAFALALTLTLFSVAVAGAQGQPPAAPAPTDRTKATRFSVEDLQAALAKLPTDRPASSVRVFSLAPYNVNVERRMPQAQGASLHEAQAEFFYVIDGTATMLTGGTLVNPTRNGTNQAASAIQGGVRQVLNKGDFFLVPAGVPWPLYPLLFPIEVIGLFTKPVALMIRLFANMAAGHIVIYFLIGLIFIFHTVWIAPIAVPFAFAIYLLEIFVALLQAYIFTVLSATFIGLASHAH